MTDSNWGLNPCATHGYSTFLGASSWICYLNLIVFYGEGIATKMQSNQVSCHWTIDAMPFDHTSFYRTSFFTLLDRTSCHWIIGSFELGWEEMRSRRAVHKVILYYKIVNNLCLNYLKNQLSVQVSERTSYSLRNL